MALLINIPAGATGLSISHSSTASGATSGTLKTVAVGKVCVVTSIRGLQQYTASSRVSKIRLMVDGKPVDQLVLDSSSPDTTDSNGDRTSLEKKDLNVILSAGQTLNIEIDNSNTVTKCAAEVSAYEYTP